MERVIHYTSRGLMILSAAGLVIVMIITIIDSINRKYFDASIHGISEVVEVMLPIIAYLAIPYAQTMGQHVSSGILTDRLPARAAASLRAVGMIVLLLLVLVMVWQTSAGVLESIESKEQRYGLLNVSIWPARAAIAAGFLGLFLEFCLVLKQQILVLTHVKSQTVVGIADTEE